MSTDETACARATAAAMEIVSEACEGVGGTVEEVSDRVFVFVADEAREEFTFDLDDPPADGNLEAAIEDCMDSEWAAEWADGVVGEDAPLEVDRRARRRVCEGLFSRERNGGAN